VRGGIGTPIRRAGPSSHAGELHGRRRPRPAYQIGTVWTAGVVTAERNDERGAERCGEVVRPPHPTRLPRRPPGFPQGGTFRLATTSLGGRALAALLATALRQSLRGRGATRTHRLRSWKVPVDLLPVQHPHELYGLPLNSQTDAVIPYP
jgi:hypothetical protein